MEQFRAVLLFLSRFWIDLSLKKCLFALQFALIIEPSRIEAALCNGCLNGAIGLAGMTAIAVPAMHG